MKKYLIVVDCAIEYNNKFLVIERAAKRNQGGLLSFPGGKVDPLDEQLNHDILKAGARREVLEEVGIHLEQPLKYIASHFFIDNSGPHIIAVLFHCKLREMPRVSLALTEVQNYYWMNYTEINQASNAPQWFKNYAGLIKT